MTAEPSIHELAESGDAVGIRHLLDAHPELVKARDDRNDLPLHLACLWHKTEAVETLIQRGSDLNAGGFPGWGYTALHYAVFEGDSDLPDLITIVGILLASGADPDVLDSFGFLADDIARCKVHDGLPLVLQMFEMARLQAGRPLRMPRMRRRDDDSSIHMMSLWGDEPAVADALIEQPDLAHQLTPDGRTPLHWACIGKQMGVMGPLFDAGVELNTVDNTGRTALHYAVLEGRAISSQLVWWLLREGADSNIRDNEGLTPVELAKKRMESGLDTVLCEFGRAGDLP